MATHVQASFSCTKHISMGTYTCNGSMYMYLCHALLSLFVAPASLANFPTLVVLTYYMKWKATDKTQPSNNWVTTELHLVDHTGLTSFIIAKCDRILENPPYVIFCENWVWCVFDKPYPRTNPPASLRPIALFALKIACFVCDHATTCLLYTSDAADE